MPNWIDDSGFNWFGILECKRCLRRFKTDERGEIPPHDCLGTAWKSISSSGEYHFPVPCEN